jgi:hypothetical protein
VNQTVEGKNQVASRAAAKQAIAQPLITCVDADREDAVAKESSESDGHPAPACIPLRVVGDRHRNRVEA